MGMESLRGDSSNFSVCSYLLFRFGPEMGAYPIYFSFWWLVLHPIKLALSLSLPPVCTCCFRIFSLSFLLLFAAFCLQLQCVAAPIVLNGVFPSVSVPLISCLILLAFSMRIAVPRLF